MANALIGRGMLLMCLGLPLLCGAGRGVADGQAVSTVPESSADSQLARQILSATGIQGGLVVHVGCGAGRLTAALWPSESYLVHGLDTDARNVELSRQYLQSLSLYGKVSIDRWSGSRLPYIDNLVNLLVVEKPAAVSRDEIMRVLAPLGVAYLKNGKQWTKIEKPFPQDMDEWSHYLHDASNNAVGHDALVGPPRHVQWICGPSWSRHHDHMASLSAMVSSRGRVYYIMDEGPRESILLPSQWFLVARNAFNGTLLWKRSVPEWNTQLWPLKSGPNQLPRRLVAVGERVYVTLGIDAPLTALDAATGKTLHTYAGTQHTDEVIVSSDTLFLLAAHGPNKWKSYRPRFTYVWANTSRANSEWAWDRAERSVMAIKAETGEVCWKQDRCVAPLTLAADDNGVYFYDGDKVVCLNRRNGNQKWTSQSVLRKAPFPTGYGPTLVVHKDVVLLSVENKSMTALSAADGKTLWTAEHHHGGHASPDDLLAINGLVWSAALANSKDSGVMTGRDLHTGAVKREFLPDVNPPWFHHRCYRSRATDRYFIASRTGIEFIDLEARHWDINHWVRGGCLYGFMPANGLIYVPPHSCGCFLESKLFGFNVLTADSASRRVSRTVSDSSRLERGPAFEVPSTPPAEETEDWPTYRHDPMRSGCAKTTVPVVLKQTWQADLKGKLSSLVAAGNKVFLAAVETHTIHALDADAGKSVWSFTAGGRIDSPPTIHRGRVLFGSADGYVYCLHAADGRLSWRFRAAPEERRLVAHEQLESAWPVSGSVLVQQDVVYVVAGRSAFLDGGLRLLRLDPQTGRKLSETCIDDRDPETGKNLQTKMQGQDLPVALPDILSSDGRSVYMRAQAFDLNGVRRHIVPVKLSILGGRRGQAPAAAEDCVEIGDHLFSRTGFLDDSWFWRSYWIYGKAVDSNYGGWLRPGHFAPSGRLMVLDEKRVYGFDRKPEYLCNASVQEFYLYSADREVKSESVQRVQAATRRIDAASSDRGAASSDWATRKKFPLSAQNAATFRWAQGNPPIQARALVLAGTTLFVAGPPDVLDEETAFRKPDDPAIQARLKDQAAALQGRQGGQLLVVSAADGKLLAAYALGEMPTFDGMAAARGRLYFTTVGGKVLCLGATGTPLPQAPAPRLAPLDITVKPLSALPAPGGGPSLRGDFATAVRAEVTRSELGYHLLTEGSTLGFALKKLPTPLTGKICCKMRMKITGDGGLRNGFLVFGDSTEEAQLIKCGLRLAMKKAVVVQGPLQGGKVAQQSVQADDTKTYEIEVLIDLPARQVTMKAADAVVTTTLANPPARISYVGYGALNGGADFTAVEITPRR